MATFRTVSRPDTRPCTCGGVMMPAQRYEATQIVGVLICWRCGIEDPPLYPDNTIRRAVCRWCGVRFTSRLPRGASHSGTCSDGCRRRSAAHHQLMVRTGQQNRRRAV